MKAFKFITTFLASICLLWTLSSCEQDIAVESVVYEDGSVDRTIVMSKADSAKAIENIFGVASENGWTIEVRPTERIESSEDKTKKDIVFKKHYSSVDEMNTETNSSNDTLFKIKSSFEKKFKWFYTYIKYSDTYLAINRFRSVKTEDYFTAEDYTFIQRLPAEGKSISKADSVYLLKLNEKIYDHFALRGMFENVFDRMTASLDGSENGRWRDTLTARKEELFQLIQKDKGGDEALAFQEQFLKNTGIPKSLMEKLEREFESSDSKVDFMSAAAETKFTHSIRMPWKVTESNADSVRGNVLTWQPPTIKFMLKDYTMYAEARQMNYWAVIVSATVIFITILMFVRVRKSKSVS